jgi:hypothetical protein
LARSFIAARSSAVNPLVEPVRFLVARFVAVLFSAITSTSSGQFLDTDQFPRSIAEGAVADSVRDPVADAAQQREVAQVLRRGGSAADTRNRTSRWGA